MINRELRSYGRAVLALAMVVGFIAAFRTPASASHESTTILVGVANDGSNRNNFDDSDLTRLAGTSFTFSFNNGFHNVRWTSANPGALADSPASPGGDAVGSSFTRTPSAVGTYIYYCSIHSDAATALAATDFTAARPAGMYGRLTITADTTAPTWNNANPVTATANSASQITVSWPAATDNSGSVFFDVYQNTTNTQPPTPVGDNVNALTYVATGLTSGQTYYYWVVPVDGANNAGPIRSANATTSSVAASSAASAVVMFAVNPTLSITVSPAVLDLGTLSPAAPGTGSATVTIGSNDTWSLTVKSIGRDGVDDAVGDDAVFTDNAAKTIPVTRLTWNAGGGVTPMTDVGAAAKTAQPAAAAAAVSFAYSLQPTFNDPVGTNYRTTVLYTVTQP